MIRITGASRAMGTYRLPSLLAHDRRIMTRCVGPSYFDTVQCVPVEVSAVLDLLAARRVPERLIEIAASSAIRALFEAASLTSEIARSQIITSSSDPSSSDVFMFSQLHRPPASAGTELPAQTSRWHRAVSASHCYGSKCWSEPAIRHAREGLERPEPAAPALDGGVAVELVSLFCPRFLPCFASGRGRFPASLSFDRNSLMRFQNLRSIICRAIHEKQDFWASKFEPSSGHHACRRWPLCESVV